MVMIENENKNDNDIINPKLMFEGAATLVIALAVNNTMREIINHIWPNDNKIIANIIYTVITILMVVIVIYIINNLAKSEAMNVIFSKSGRSKNINKFTRINI